MRLADIAKELRITTQELRHELAKTNFGINPTSHEVEDALGRGIVRFLATRVKPTLTRRRVAAVTVDKKGKVKPEKAENEAAIDKTSKPASNAVSVAVAPPDQFRDIQKGGQATPVSSKSEDHVPAAHAPRPEGVNLAVSRRIEVAPTTMAQVAERLPHTYYKTKNKHRHKKERGEDQILEVLKRHPHSGEGRKQQVARVIHSVDTDDQLALTALGIERELDREHFRDQKKHRAIGQKRGPKAQPQIKEKVGIIKLPETLSVKEFSEKIGLAVPEVMSHLIKNGIMATINQIIDFDTAAILADEMKVQVVKVQDEATSADLFSGNLEKLLHEDDPKNLQPRPPVISVMGHVDHGKTKILDTIRNTHVIDTEAGGITQHIGAYQVEKNGHKITFLDTPGHEAFTAMRARGAKATDIAILVVAAEEGIKPQTIEAIHHAQEAGIPIIVAINKIDKPTANIEKVKGELAQYSLQSEDWGGKTIMVPVSAMTGQGIDRLLEMILLTAEMEDLKANPNRSAVGTVIESNLDPSLGPVATVLVNAGTLNIGDNIVVGSVLGKVKAMHDHTGKNLHSVGPSGAVKISGLESVPQAGDILQTFTRESLAKKRAAEMSLLIQGREKARMGSMVDRLVSQISTGKIKFLKVVLKTDTKGSLEAIMQELAKIRNNDIAIKVIHYGVGNISDTDVIMASASEGLLIGFHTTANAHVRRVAEKEHVDIRIYTVIYKLIEDLKSILSGMLEAEEIVLELGKLKVKKIFLDKKKWVIAGCDVIQGKVERGASVRLIRGGERIFETKIENLKHGNEDAKMLDEGSECGIKINTPKPIVEGDVFEVCKTERRERTLS